jgi:hypothetical protein
MRRHLSYANVVATLALVFAMTGGAIAAKHYLINSTSQINPKVIKKLKGKTGKDGAPGKQGATGATGSPGAEGKPGPTGPSNAYTAFNPSNVDLKFKGEVAKVAVAVPAGSYVVVAKMQAINETKARQNVACTLSNDVNEVIDESEVAVEPVHEGENHYDGRAEPVLEVAGALATAGHWQLECLGSASSETLKGRNARITAIQVGSVP